MTQPCRQLQGNGHKLQLHVVPKQARHLLSGLHGCLCIILIISAIKHYSHGGHEQHFLLLQLLLHVSPPTITTFYCTNFTPYSGSLHGKRPEHLSRLNIDNFILATIMYGSSTKVAAIPGNWACTVIVGYSTCMQSPQKTFFGGTF